MQIICRLRLCRTRFYKVEMRVDSNAFFVFVFCEQRTKKYHMNVCIKNAIVLLLKNSIVLELLVATNQKRYSSRTISSYYLKTL